MPSPHDVLWRLFDSPVPTYTRSGLFCETAMSPIDINPCSWSCASHVAPLFVVFHTPPCAAPTYQMFVFGSYTAMSAIRPDIEAGPICRKCSESNGVDCEGAPDCARPGSDWTPNASARAAQAASKRDRFMKTLPGKNLR